MTISRLATYKIADEERRAEIEQYIDGITDPQTREMFRLHFLEGLSYSRTAAKVGGKMSGSGVAKRISRHVQK